MNRCLGSRENSTETAEVPSPIFCTKVQGGKVRHNVRQYFRKASLSKVYFSHGISMFFLKLPILSNACSRFASRSHTYTNPPLDSLIQCGNSSMPFSASVWSSRHWRKNSPFFSNTAIRLLPPPCPSATSPSPFCASTSTADSPNNSPPFQLTRFP